MVDVQDRTLDGALQNLLRPSIEVLGYELLGIEPPSGSGGVLRVYIDSEQGITVEDCEQVSRQVSQVLDVEDPIIGHYTLEVSSPGLDRPLFTPEHYRRFCGHEILLRLHLPLDGRRKVQGVLITLRDGEVIVEDGTGEGGRVAIPLDAVRKANLVPEL